MKRPFGITVLACPLGVHGHSWPSSAALRFLRVMFRPVGIVVPGFWHALMYGWLAWACIPADPDAAGASTHRPLLSSCAVITVFNPIAGLHRAGHRWRAVRRHLRSHEHSWSTP